MTPGIGVSFIISTVIHLAVFLLLLWWGQLSANHGRTGDLLRRCGQPAQ